MRKSLANFSTIIDAPVIIGEKVRLCLLRKNEVLNHSEGDDDVTLGEQVLNEISDRLSILLSIRIDGILFD